MSRFSILISVAVLLFGCKTDHAGDHNAEVVSVDQVVAVNPFDSITALIKNQPDNPDLLHERGKMFLEAGDADGAMGDVGRAIIMDSTNSDYYLTISDIYFRANRPAESMSSLKMAQSLAPNKIEPHLRLAEFYLYIQDYKEAVLATNNALKIDPRSDRAFFLKGICYKEVGDTIKAVKQFEQTVENNPDHVDAYVEMAILYGIKGDELAEQYYKNALRVDPNSKEALYGLGLYYQDFDMLNEAMAAYTELLQKHPDYAPAHYNMGFINFEFIKDRKLALKHFNDAVLANPDYVQAIYMRGLCYESLGNVAKAKAEYQFALEKDPGFQLALNGLNRVL